MDSLLDPRLLKESDDAILRSSISATLLALQPGSPERTLDDALANFNSAAALLAPIASTSSHSPSQPSPARSDLHSDDATYSLKRHRGRPKGSKDSPSVDPLRRGRPKGSKNLKGTKQQLELAARVERGEPPPAPKLRSVPRPRCRTLLTLFSRLDFIP